MDLVTNTIERSKWNIVKINGSKYTYHSRFAPHGTPRWCKEDIENQRKNNSCKYK